MWKLTNNNLIGGDASQAETSRRLRQQVGSEVELSAARDSNQDEFRKACDQLNGDVRTGAENFAQRKLEHLLGNTMLVFLSSLAMMAMAAAGITAFETVVHDFPKLWQQINEYNALQQVIQNLLLIAIAAELGMLLLFHRTTAAVEVIIFVIARKMLTPDISVTGLALCTLSIVGLVIMRFHYLPGKPK